MRGARDGRAVMSLVERAFCRKHRISADNPTLVEAPLGTHSVVATGTTDAPSSGDVLVQLDGREVVVPLAPAAPTGIESMFNESEDLLYGMSQARLRYIVVVR